MSEKHYVITYRIKRSVKPARILEALEALMEKHSVYYDECLFRVQVSICEFEHEGKLHTNRNRNAIRTLVKQHPELEAFHQYSCLPQNQGLVIGKESVGNVSLEDFSRAGIIPYELIRDTVRGVPRPYGVNELALMYRGIDFMGSEDRSRHERLLECGSETADGNYMYYERSNNGDEKHSFVYFSMEKEDQDALRKLFFEFAEMIPGVYEGTECIC